MESKIESELLPTDFDLYLPWACKQLRIPYVVTVERIYEVLYAPKNIVPIKKSLINITSATNVITASGVTSMKSSIKMPESDVLKNVVIETMYDSGDNMIQIKFKKSKGIMITDILKTMNFIIKFQHCLTSIQINTGLNQEGMVELNKTLSLTRITDVILDGTVIPQANYYILLENENSALNYLSLARCSIQDVGLELLALKLTESNIFALNLSSNGISDIGASYLGNVLRKNRRLRYLNLADNRISDEGAGLILSSLIRFQLNAKEVAENKMTYFKHMKEQAPFESELASVPRSATLMNDKNKNIMRKSELLPKHSEIKHKTSADNRNTIFNDLFEAGLKKINGVTYCYGNNILSCISLAYNYLSYLSVKKLLEVLRAQKNMNRNPKGLINVSIEGNNLPVDCKELQEINEILGSGLSLTKPTSRGDKKVESNRTY